jgi:hypothetical protein
LNDQPPHDETAISMLGLLPIPPVHRPNGLVCSGYPTKMLRAFLPKKKKERKKERKWEKKKKVSF